MCLHHRFGARADRREPQTEDRECRCGGNADSADTPIWLTRQCARHADVPGTQVSRWQAHRFSPHADSAVTQIRSTRRCGRHANVAGTQIQPARRFGKHAELASTQIWLPFRFGRHADVAGTQIGGAWQSCGWRGCGPRADSSCLPSAVPFRQRARQICCAVTCAGMGSHRGSDILKTRGQLLFLQRWLWQAPSHQASKSL